MWNAIWQRKEIIGAIGGVILSLIAVLTFTFDYLVPTKNPIDNYRLVSGKDKLAGEWCFLHPIFSQLNKLEIRDTPSGPSAQLSHYTLSGREVVDEPFGSAKIRKYDENTLLLDYDFNRLFVDAFIIRGANPRFFRLELNEGKLLRTLNTKLLSCR